MIGLETWLDGLRDWLRQDLAARIAAVNDAHDDFELEVPPTEQINLGVTDTAIAYPYVEVAAPDWDLTDFSIGHVSAEFDFILVVRLMAQDANYDTLYRKNMRYTACLLSSILSDGGLAAMGNATITSVRGVYRVNPETGDNQAYLGGSLAVLTVNQAADFIA